MITPLLTIIVPVFRAEPYLRQCLLSLLRRQGENEAFEVIAVDDASPDGSARILNDISRLHSNLHVIRFPENRGVGAARNAGIDAALGEWLAFCDSDDAFAPGAIPRLVRELKGATSDVAIFDLARVKQSGSVPAVSTEPTGKLLEMNDPSLSVPFVRQVFPNRLWAWNKCFRRSLVGSLRFPDFQPCEDAVFSLNCLLRAKQILIIPEVLYEYVQHKGSCMKTVSPSRVRGDIRGMEALFGTIAQWAQFAEVRSSVRSSITNIFLRGTAARLTPSYFGDANVRTSLATDFLGAAKRVFCDPRLCNGAQRLLFRMLFATKSVRLLSLFLRIETRIRRLLPFRKRS